MSVLDRPRSAPAGAGIGVSAPRPDGVPKVRGQFLFSSDLWAEGMLWGHVLRSPVPAARIRRIDVAPALCIDGVRAVVTAADLPGAATFGLEVADQPVFASDVVRYVGEPLAAVAADHPETARRAAGAIVVDYEPIEPLCDPEMALRAPAIHPDGNVFRHLRIEHGEAFPQAAVVVEGTYEVGMQDQAFLGPESGLAVPGEDGGVDLYIATQWLHVDRDQVARCLGLPCDKVRLHLAGVGGAFGAREDVSIQVHLCLLALTTGRPVKIVLGREDSFFAHVHRHPARIWLRHHADPEGRLLRVEGRVVLDGGAYASSSNAVISNATAFATGPYRVPSATVEGWVVRTNNPPCGAMRGFGAVQACFAYEAQMDRLARALAIDPVELRLRNVLRPGDRLITGQRIDGTAPVAEVVRAAANAPLPPGGPADLPAIALPGGAGRAADVGRVRRGVGFAVGYKNLMYSEGFDDSSEARVRLELVGTAPVATVTCAAAEVGQGFVTLARQIVAEELGVEDTVLAPPSTATVGSAGSTSASRQTWMSGGAVAEACRAAARQLLLRARAGNRVAADAGLPPDLDAAATSGDPSGGVSDAHALGALGVAALAELLGAGPVEASATFHHRPTQPLDSAGQGDAHVSFAFAAHRAVVDVDVDLGLVKVVQVATAQDVGRVLNPLQVLGQVEGGIAQGVGLAVMEEIVLDRGLVRNPSFTDYLLPTALDMPEVTVAALVEQPEPGAPFGAKGVGEPPTISSTPAVVAAIRAATGLELDRVPVRPADIALAPRPAQTSTPARADTPARPAAPARPSEPARPDAGPAGPAGRAMVPAREDLLGLPGIELHVHLEGSFTPERVAELARAAGEPDVDRRVRSAFAAGDLADLLTALDWWCGLVRTEEQATSQAEGFARFLASSGVVYAEVTVNPTHWGGLPRRALIDALAAGFERATTPGAPGALGSASPTAPPAEACDCRLVVSLRRDQDEGDIRRVLDELGSRRPARVVALGVDGDERSAAARRRVLAEAFAEAAHIGLGRTAHAGESSGPEGVLAALDDLGVTRIDHGVRAVEDPSVLSRLRDQRVTLDVCPTSNARLLYGTLDRHPLAALDAAGLALSIGTDDPLIFGVDLPEELSRAARLAAWDLPRLRRCQHDALDAAFCDDATRSSLSRRLAPWDTSGRKSEG